MTAEKRALSRPIGVLALQGDFAAHGRTIEALDQPWIEIKYPEQLKDVSGLILPGGESTTLTKLLRENFFLEPIVSASCAGMPVYGSCAGAILLSKEVIGNDTATLGLIDVVTQRNAYGRQIDSFIAHEPCPTFGPPDLEMVFIRAPVVRCVGTGVEVLATCKDHPVFLRQGNAMLTTFHPELSDDTRIHGLFVEMALQAEAVTKMRGSLKGIDTAVDREVDRV
jgi:5'-phosphate synthase pdxT subunit